MFSETQSERKVRMRAAYLRKQFERNGEAICNIISRLSDDQLVSMEAEHHKVRVKAMAEKPQRPPLQFTPEIKTIAAPEKERRWLRWGN
jgi:hypothetical protein